MKEFLSSSHWWLSVKLACVRRWLCTGMVRGGKFTAQLHRNSRTGQTQANEENAELTTTRECAGKEHSWGIWNRGDQLQGNLRGSSEVQQGKGRMQTLVEFLGFLVLSWRLSGSFRVVLLTLYEKNFLSLLIKKKNRGLWYEFSVKIGSGSLKRSVAEPSFKVGRSWHRQGPRVMDGPQSHPEASWRKVFNLSLSLN